MPRVYRCQRTLSWVIFMQRMILDLKEVMDIYPTFPTGERAKAEMFLL